MHPGSGRTETSFEELVYRQDLNEVYLLLDFISGRPTNAYRIWNARRRTVMIIESVTRLAFAAGCLTAIATLPTAHAQMSGPPPGAYGYGPPRDGLRLYLAVAEGCLR